MLFRGKIEEKKYSSIITDATAYSYGIRAERLRGCLFFECLQTLNLLMIRFLPAAFLGKQISFQA